MAANYHRRQGSVYQHDDISAGATWVSMYNLCNVEPLGIFPSVVTAVQMYHVVFPVMIATDAIRLGGNHTPAALAPTPRGLFPDNMQPALIPLLHPPNPLPRNVSYSPAAQHGPNWAL